MNRTLTRTATALALCLACTQPTSAQSIAGPYLAARAAAMNSDYDKAASYFSRALAQDRDNVELMESALVALLGLGDVDRAVPIAQSLVRAGQNSQVAQMALTADAIKREDYVGLLARDLDIQGIGPLVDGLIQAWAHVGAGEIDKAKDAFDTVSREVGLQGFAMFHKALALASTGDFAGADAIFSSDQAGVMIQTRRGVMARVEILSQLGRNDEAQEVLRQMFAGATDPELDQMISQMANGETLPFAQVMSTQDGFAEVFYSIAAALRSEAGPEYTLLYVQIARDLRPQHTDAILLAAELFETLEQYDQAIDAYAQVSPDDPAYHVAILGRAAALRQSNRTDDAVAVLEDLAESHGGLAVVQSSLGDALRQQERYSEAVKAYDLALNLSEGSGRTTWFLHYARGIAYERLGNWDKSESDFRAALSQNPDQPQVLNYLGYSLVEQKIKLDEALGMIQKAVEKSPDSGYIIDSLGWALYRMGRYEEAVPHMERAVELMAVDPVVNDHLGDVYWAVGRQREAQFQWARALSFVDPDDTDGEADPERIRRKLEIGLDAVLSEEGAAPLKVAKDG